MIYKVGTVYVETNRNEGIQGIVELNKTEYRDYIIYPSHSKNECQLPWQNVSGSWFQNHCFLPKIGDIGPWKPRLVAQEKLTLCKVICRPIHFGEVAQMCQGEDFTSFTANWIKFIDKILHQIIKEFMKINFKGLFAHSGQY